MRVAIAMYIPIFPTLHIRLCLLATKIPVFFLCKRFNRKHISASAPTSNVFSCHFAQISRLHLARHLRQTTILGSQLRPTSWVWSLFSLVYHSRCFHCRPLCDLSVCVWAFHTYFRLSKQFESSIALIMFLDITLVKFQLFIKPSIDGLAKENQADISIETSFCKACSIFSQFERRFCIDTDRYMSLAMRGFSDHDKWW